MKYKAILFDLDGTLFDLNRFILEFTTAFSKKHNIPISNHYEMHQKIFRGESELDTTLQELFKKENKEIQPSKIKFVNGFDTVIQKLKDDGFILGIVSSSPKGRIEIILEAKGITNFFSVIVGKEDTAERKPSAQPLLKAIEALNIQSNQTLYVGDSQEDIESAQNAKVDCAFYANNKIYFKSLETWLKTNKPALIFDNPKELIEFVEE